MIFEATLNAVAYRIRGGFMPTGSTTLARAVWAVAVGLIAAIHTDIVTASSMGLMAFIGLIAVGHASHQDMGTRAIGYAHDGDKAEWLTNWLPTYDLSQPLWQRQLIDFTGLAVIGIFRIALIFVPDAVNNPEILWYALAGIGHGAAYLIAQYTMPMIGGSFDGQATERGEVYWGAMQGLAIGYALSHA